MNSTTATVSVMAVVLVVTAGFAGLGAARPQAADAGTVAFQAQNQTANDTATITVSATGQASADPDVALVQVTATAVGPTPETAAERLSRNVSRLREALLAANVSREQLQTTGFTVFQRAVKPNRTDRNRTEFVARQSFEIRLENVTRVGEIVDVAVASGADQVEGVRFTLSEQTRRELRQKALREAVTSARAQAQALAESAGLQLAGVRSISTFEPEFVVARETADVSVVGAPETVIDAGPVTVTATVSVTYNATN